MASAVGTLIRGVSSETKWTTLPSGLAIPEGTIWENEDTGTQFYWTGSAWASRTLPSAGSVTVAAGSAIIGKVGTDQTTHGTTDLVAADVTKVGGSAFALGQALAAASLPVVLPVAQITSLTAPVLAAGSAVIGKVSIDQTTPGTTNLVDTELPAAAALADAASNPTSPMVGVCLLLWNGATWDRVRVPSTYKPQSTVAIGTIATVWTPTSGKKFRLMGGSISISAAGSVLFEDNSAGNGTIFQTPKLAADTPFNFDIPGGKLSAAANNVLKATGSTTMNLLGTLWGTEE